MFYKKGGGDIWSLLTLNNVFFLGKMEKTRVAEGGFTYSHNIISIYHPKWWFFGEDQKCSWGPKMKNKPNCLLITGVSQTGGGSAAWEFFPHNPVFFSDNDPYVNIQDSPLGKGNALKIRLNVCCQMPAWISDTITPQLNASEGAGRKTTLMLGSNLHMFASAQMLHHHQTPLWIKISVKWSAVETKAWSAVGGGEWMSMRQVGEAS